MTTDQIIEILDTRLSISREDGNPTEASFLLELLKLAEEFKKLKGDEKV